MGKISKKTICELREFLDRGCSYAGTQDVVDETITETLEELDMVPQYRDEITLYNGFDSFVTVGDFADAFWDKVVEKILNVIETQE